jgi:predicted metal-dependent TIM-barrel fold hydrolase
MTMTLTKIKNATKKVYNGFKPWVVLNVEPKQAERYLLEGWTKVGVAEKEVENAGTPTLQELQAKAKELGITTKKGNKNKTAEELTLEIAEKEVENAEDGDDNDPDLEDELE